jgi:hypothetical protein
MTSAALPPALAVWLVDLFASPREADALLGDLREEFAEVAARDGVTRARAWYWRHALRSMLHLAAGSIVQQPWRWAAVGILGLLTTWPLAWGTRWIAEQMVIHWPVYYYVSARVFWDAAGLAPLALTGFVVSLSRQRPMAAALAVLAAMLLVIGVIEPILMTIVDPQPRRTPGFFAMRAIGALAFWGPAVLAGAVAGRKLTGRWRLA